MKRVWREIPDPGRIAFAFVMMPFLAVMLVAAIVVAPVVLLLACAVDLKENIDRWSLGLPPRPRRGGKL